MPRPAINDIIIDRSGSVYTVAGYKMDPAFLIVNSLDDRNSHEVIHVSNYFTTPFTISDLRRQHITTSAQLLAAYPELFL